MDKKNIIEILDSISKEIENIEIEINNKFSCDFIFKDLRKKITVLEKNILNNNTKREIIIDFINLNREIYKAERLLELPKYFEGTGFFHFNNLRKLVNNLYEKIFTNDDKEYPIIEFIEIIIDDGMTYYDIDLVSEEIKNKYKVSLKKGNVSMNKNGEIEMGNNIVEEESFIISSGLINEYPQANLKFNNINEILDFIEKKGYYKF